MKILKENFTRLCVSLPCLRQLRSVAIGLCVLLSTYQAYGQNEKKISYPVKVQIERTAVSSAPAAPPLTAPAPVIRPIDEASATPPPVRKAAKTAANTANQKPAAITNNPVKKASVKTATTPAKAKAETKAPIAKTTTKAASKNPAVPIKAPAPKNVTAAKKPAPTRNITTESKPVPVIAPATKPANPPAPVVNTLKAAVAPVATASVIRSVVADEEEQLNQSAFDDEDISGVLESDEIKPSVAVITPAGKKAPLPVTNPHEAFVLEFKKYVETKIVPRVPGVAVAVIADGKVKVLEAYGVKKIGGTDPIDLDTAFRLASVSKTIAGTTAGVLVNEGLMTWDTPITSVLPDIKFSNPRYGNQLTLRNIMSQSSGLPTHSGDNFIEEGLSFEEVLQKLRFINFVCPPGKCYTYQNVTMSLLANVIQKKTGKTYEQYVKEKLFTPLGMRSASIGLEGLLATKNYALPHELTARGKWYTKEITPHYYRLNPAAGGNASISDMARWILAHMGQNPEVLPPSTLKAVHAKVTKNTAAQSHYGARDGVTDTHYGMGWRTFDYRGDKNFLHHGGYVFGSRSEMVLNAELQIGMVILSNSNKLPGSVIFEFLDAYEDQKRGKRTILPSAPVKKKAVNKK